ncbi:AraC family transcriptional regulator [Paenibacillus amylolyticus]|nr:AraC family transcriptional regulator [Paenibacillus amylolyticus]WFR64659.1 AraC family transcriptional regulator [Paenibacillus amylolyticus]
MMSIILGEQFKLTCRRCTSNTTFREVFHAHSQMEITYIHEGYGQLITEGQIFSLEPGMLLIFRPFQLHHIQIQVSSQRPFIRNVLMFELDLLKAHWSHFLATHLFIHDLLGEPSPIQPIRLAATSLLIQRMEQFDKSYPELLPYETGEDTCLFLLDSLTQLRYLWKEVETGYSHVSTPSSPNVLHPHAKAIMKWIEQHYQEPFRLEQIADALHLSPYHLSHVFKKATGTTIIAYAQATRIRHACVLLTSSSLTVPEIGHRVGMTSPSYFCKVFRNATGSTPHQYRLKVQGKK